jgi:hypothetical protein
VNTLLLDMLALAVPLRILEYEKVGGPTEPDLARTQSFGIVLAEKGDVLLFGGKKKGEAAELFNRLADAVAVMAFCPGGVKVGSARYCSAVSGAEMPPGPSLTAFLARLRKS